MLDFSGSEYRKLFTKLSVYLIPILFLSSLSAYAGKYDDVIFDAIRSKDIATLKKIATEAPETFLKTDGSSSALEHITNLNYHEVVSIVAQSNPKILIEGLRRVFWGSLRFSQSHETFRVLATRIPELFSEEIGMNYPFYVNNVLNDLVKYNRAEIIEIIAQVDPNILIEGLKKRGLVSIYVPLANTDTLKVLAKYAPGLFYQELTSFCFPRGSTPLQMLPRRDISEISEIAAVASPGFWRSFKQQALQQGWKPRDIDEVETYVKNLKLLKKELRAVDLVRRFNITHPNSQGSKNALLLAAAGNNPNVDLTKMIKSVLCQGGGCGCRSFGEMFSRVNIAAQYHQHRDYQGASKDGKALEFTPKTYIHLLDRGSIEDPEVAEEIFFLAKNLARREKLILYSELSEMTDSNRLKEKLFKSTLFIQPEENDRQETEALKAQILQMTIPFLKLSPESVSKVRAFAEKQPEETRLELENLLNWNLKNIR